MPKPAAHALTWCHETATYTVRDTEHDRTLAAIFGDTLTLTPQSQEWFIWLASIPSFAFLGRAGHFTARRETKQRGESYWVAYQRADGKLWKRYLGRTCDLTAEKLEATAGSMRAGPASSSCTGAPKASPPVPTIAPHAWELIPQSVMDMNIGQAPKGPPYDDTYWIPDRSHFPLVEPTKVSFDSFSCRNCGDMRHGSKLAKICVSLSVEDWPCFMALPRLPRLPTSGLSAPIWKRSPQPTFQ